jgi:hypothetical protein
MIDVPHIAKNADGFPMEVPCWDTVKESRSQFKALLWCSRGHVCTICGHEHTISDDGTVSPSCVCPREGCTFHEFVRLVGWENRNE